MGRRSKAKASNQYVSINQRAKPAIANGIRDPGSGRYKRCHLRIGDIINISSELNEKSKRDSGESIGASLKFERIDGTTLQAEESAV